MAEERHTLHTARAALDSGLITEADYACVKDAFLKAQQIKAGLDAGFIQESDYQQVKAAFLQALNLQTAPGASHTLASTGEAAQPSGGLQQRASGLSESPMDATPAAVSESAPSSRPSSAAQSPVKTLPQGLAPAPAAAAAAPAPPAPLGPRSSILPTNIPSMGGTRRPKQNGTSMSGIIVEDDAINMYYFLKAKSTYRWAMWRIDDSGKKVILCNVGDANSSYQELLDALPETDCRFAVYDYQFTNSDNCVFNKLVFISWAPDTARIKLKMMYASTKDFFKGYLDGLSVELQASELDDITEDTVGETVRAVTTRS
ncbi:hypothetical protein WJX73_001605 [Symbiochloris irregularis]|uniref:ADF-H domain-containing protein n=1 Tax=Symbiochloris irregularis TaxID=706552 RepID=A0AAW1PAX9_9CHLO